MPSHHLVSTPDLSSIAAARLAVVRHWSVANRMECCSPSITPRSLASPLDTAVGAGGVLAPIPHAVVLIGGYERRDALSLVADRLMSAIPSLSASSTAPKVPTAHTAKHPRQCRRNPSYFANSNLMERLAAKGCRYMGDDVISVSLPVASGAAPTRQSVALCLGNVDVQQQDLVLEASSSRRDRMRGRFGYSLSLLTQSLPPSLFHVVNMIESWEKQATHTEGETGGTSSSGIPFLLSSVMHSLHSADFCATADEIISGVLSRHSTLTVEESFLRLSARALHGEAVVLANFPADQQNALRISLRFLLASAAVKSLLDTEEARHRTNFFLPCEHFDHLDSLRLWEHRQSSSQAVWLRCVNHLMSLVGV